MAEQQTPIFTLDLGANGGLLAPSTVADLRAWVHSESEFWQQTIAQSQMPQGDLLAALQQLNNLRSLVDGLHDDAPPEKIMDANQRLEALYSSTCLPHTSTPKAVAIAEYRRTEGQHLANHYAVAICSPRNAGFAVEPRAFSATKGLADGFFDRTILEQRGEAVRGTGMSLDAILQDAYEVLGKRRLELQSLAGSASDAINDFQRKAADGEQAFALAQEDRDSRFKVLLGQHEALMNKLRERYQAEHALRAPLDYWSGKQSTHRTKANELRGFVFGGIAGALVLEFGVAALLFICTEWPDTVELSLLALGALLAVWSVRLLVRMYLSHLHLETDAGERVVMLQTYLALVDGNHLSDKEDRKLVLEPLFRPTGDGIVKDEGLPPSIAEFFSRTPKAG